MVAAVEAVVRTQRVARRALASCGFATLADFSEPQPFNCTIGEGDASDQTGARSIPVPAVLFDPPPATGIEADADLYPPRRHGVVGPRMRRRVW